MKEEVLTIRIKESEKKALKELADKLDITMSHLLREAIRKLLKENTEQE